MSRKRSKKSPPPSKRASASVNAPESQDSDAIPDEILAEGSGPQEALEAAADGDDRIERTQREELESVAAEMAEKLVADLGGDAAVQVSVSGVDAEADARDATSKGKKSRKSRGAKAEQSAEASDAEGPASVDMAAAAESSIDELSDAEISSDAERADDDAESTELDDDALDASTDGERAAEMLASDGEVSATGEEAAEGEAAEMPSSAGTMDRGTIKQLIEALVFAADKPVTVQRLRQLTRISDVAMIETMLVEIQSDYEQRGLILTSVSGGWQFRTRPQFSGWVQQLIAGRPVRLSRAQLETLAIVAYRQPITRPEIDDIRGVDSSATLKLLMDRQLIRILGKREEAGRPMLYGTTKEFLDFFSLGDLRELPTLREYSELTDESRKVVSERLGIPLEAAGSGWGGGNDGNGGSGGGEGGSGDGGGFDPFGGEGGEPGNANGDESSVEARRDETANDELGASGDESNETSIDARDDVSNETVVEASSDEMSNDELEASSDESNETAIEASSDESSEESIEASSDESNETAIEASSDETSNDVIEASSDAPSNDAIEASSDETSRDEALEASSGEGTIDTSVEVSDDSDSHDSLSALASRVLAKSDESEADASTASETDAAAPEEDGGEMFAAGHVRARADAAPAAEDESELASGSQAFAAISDDQVQAILAEGSESVLAEGLDVESMVGAMAATDEDAASLDATDGAGDGMVAANELVSTDDIVDDLPEPTE